MTDHSLELELLRSNRYQQSAQVVGDDQAVRVKQLINASVRPSGFQAWGCERAIVVETRADASHVISGGQCFKGGIAPAGVD
jgi:hypothetical protein